MIHSINFTVNDAFLLKKKVDELRFEKYPTLPKRQSSAS